MIKWESLLGSFLGSSEEAVLEARLKQSIEQKARLFLKDPDKYLPDETDDLDVSKLILEYRGRK